MVPSRSQVGSLFDLPRLRNGQSLEADAEHLSPLAHKGIYARLRRAGEVGICALVAQIPGEGPFRKFETAERGPSPRPSPASRERQKHRPIMCDCPALGGGHHDNLTLLALSSQWKCLRDVMLDCCKELTGAVRLTDIPIAARRSRFALVAA